MSNDNWTNRNLLVEREKKYIEKWKAEGTFNREVEHEREKIMGTFPFPYLNGKLHLGHALTVTQLDCFLRKEQQKGKNTLFPFGYHGTGMPIAAAALKLKEELHMHEKYEGGIGNQMRTMLSMGLKMEELPKFTNPNYWLEYFPGPAKTHLQRMGLMIDFRRSFITTEVNPWFDNFIRWHFHHLNKRGHLKVGQRYTIYCPKDSQPCADHDRSSGEGVKPKKFTVMLMKLRDYRWSNEEWNKQPLHLAVATLRIETMFGQTNVWVNPTAWYDLLEVDGKRFFAQPEVYRNLSMQMGGESFTKVELLGASVIRGDDLLNRFVQAPMSKVDTWIPVLPMDSVQKRMGTGIVTSVPAHSPADYANFMACLKPGYLASLISPETKRIIQGFEVKSFISVDDDSEYGLKMMQERELTPGKKAAIEEVHGHLYKVEQAKGVLTDYCTDLAGLTVEQAQREVYQRLQKDNLAFEYYEPESVVVSRSGDVCVVALLDNQWYIDYGNAELKKRAKEHLDRMTLTPDNTRKMFEYSNDWIEEWPVSRSFGLGTQLLDTEFKIDSLSDSTIYMAYYSIADRIQQIPKEKLSLQLWDYIFFKDKEIPDGVDAELLTSLRDAFRYWYPMDMRVSGLDLIGNHLLMAVYNHIMIWPDEPELWPRAYSINGYVVVDKVPMSKSKGNFMTMEDVLNTYGADATRISLVEAGEGTDSANFSSVNANDAIMWLTRNTEWLEDWMKTNTYGTETGFWEMAYENKLRTLVNTALEFYENMQPRQALVQIRKILQIRDEYRTLIDAGVVPGNKELMVRIMQRVVSLLHPIAPFWTTYHAEQWGWPLDWPKTEEVSNKFEMHHRFINNALKQVRQKLEMMRKRKKEGISLKFSLVSHYAEHFAGLVEEFPIGATREEWDSAIKGLIKKQTDKKLMGVVGSFARYFRDLAEDFGPTAVDIMLNHTSELNEAVMKWTTIIIAKLDSFTDLSINVVSPDRVKKMTSPGVLGPYVE